MIDPALAREHLKADNEDVEDDLLAQYIASSKTICEGYCNRKFYEDAEALAEDRILAKADLTLAITERDEELSDLEHGSCEVRNAVSNVWIIHIAAIKARLNGIVVDDTVIAAMLLVLGHLYFNRQEVVVAQYSGATQLPAGAKRILEPYLWIGDLA